MCTDQKRPEIRKSSPSSGFLEARDGGEGSAEGVILNVFFFYPFPDSFMYSTIYVFLLLRSHNSFLKPQQWISFNTERLGSDRQ